jgi:hypothetical protein
MVVKRKRRKAPKQHPEHWYVEDRASVDVLVDFLRAKIRKRLWRRHLFRQPVAVWDPACGGGNIPRAFADQGFEAVGSDIVDRGSENFIRRDNFLIDPIFLPTDKTDLPIDIVASNPPYKHSEAFIRRALTLGARYVAMLLPLSFLSGEARGKGLFAEHPPRWVATLSRRPTMPPGDKIAELGDAAFKGGKITYCWMIWDTKRPWYTRLPGWPKTEMLWFVPRTDVP